MKAADRADVLGSCPRQCSSAPQHGQVTKPCSALVSRGGNASITVSGPCHGVIQEEEHRYGDCDTGVPVSGHALDHSSEHQYSEGDTGVPWQQHALKSLSNMHYRAFSLYSPAHPPAQTLNGILENL